VEDKVPAKKKRRRNRGKKIKREKQSETARNL
jgi:hypothetical protein